MSRRQIKWRVRLYGPPGGQLSPWNSAAWMIMLCCLLITGCGNPEAALRPLSNDAVILAFGDSLTQGAGAGEGEDYPSLLAKLLGRTVINAGVPGETSDRGLKRLPGLLEKYRPSLVILCHGGNDILRNVNAEFTEANIREMIALARRVDAQVILIGVPNKSLFLSTAPFYARVAEDLGVVVEDAVIRDVLTSAEWKSDSVHPNAEGYRVIATRIADLVR